MQHVLVVAPYAFFSPGFETDLELCQQYLDAGDQVTLLRCQGEMLACDAQGDRGSVNCTLCQAKGNRTQAQVTGGPNVRSLYHLTRDDVRRLDEIPDRFSDPQELRAYQFDGFDAGI